MSVPFVAADLVERAIPGVSIDKSGDCQRARRHAIPQTKICLDPFHVYQLIESFVWPELVEERL